MSKQKGSRRMMQTNLLRLLCAGDAFSVDGSKLPKLFLGLRQTPGGGRPFLLDSTDKASSLRWPHQNGASC